MSPYIRNIWMLIVATALCGCSHSYVTPGGAASFMEYTDVTLTDHYNTSPATNFPANLVLVRIQDSGFYSQYHGHQRGGRYAVVTARDIESDQAFARISELDDVAGVATIGRIMLPRETNAIKDLRVPAAQLRADMLLVYSVETVFSVDGQQLGPLSVLSLGLLRNRSAKVTATVSGMLVDVRTGFIYGTTEATDIQEKKTSLWSTELVIEAARRKAESNAFDAFVGEFETLWPGVVGTHKASLASGLSAPPAGDRYHTVRFNRH